MKKTILLLCLLAVFSTSCSNNDNDLIDHDHDTSPDNDTVGQTYEIPNVDFIAPDYVANINFAQANLEVFDSDVILVYRLEDIVNNEDVWEPLPTSTVYITDTNNNEINIHYRYNFTKTNIEIILESNAKASLGDEFTKNQIFRIIVVPSILVKRSKMDINDINSVIKTLKLNTNNITQINLKQ